MRNSALLSTIHHLRVKRGIATYRSHVARTAVFVHLHKGRVTSFSTGLHTFALNNVTSQQRIAVKLFVNSALLMLRDNASTSCAAILLISYRRGFTVVSEGASLSEIDRSPKPITGQVVGIAIFCRKPCNPAQNLAAFF